MEETYKLSLTGEQIQAKLDLLDGDSSTAKIKSDKITVEKATTATDSDLTLATKGYVDSKAASGGGDANLPSGATEGAFLVWSNGKATWATIANAEDNTF